MLILSRDDVVVTGSSFASDPDEGNSYRERIYLKPTLVLLPYKVVALEIVVAQRGWSESIWQMSLLLGSWNNGVVKREYSIPLYRCGSTCFPHGSILLSRWRKLVAAGENWHHTIGDLILTFYKGVGAIKLYINLEEVPSMRVQARFEGSFPTSPWSVYGSLPPELNICNYFYLRSTIDD